MALYAPFLAWHLCWGHWQLPHAHLAPRLIFCLLICTPWCGHTLLLGLLAGCCPDAAAAPCLLASRYNAFIFQHECYCCQLVPVLLYDASFWCGHAGWWGYVLGIAPVTCCSTVSITNNRCDLCAGAGSRVERDYTRPYTMHCATDREAEDGRGIRILRRYLSRWKLVVGGLASVREVSSTSSGEMLKAVCKLARTFRTG